MSRNEYDLLARALRASKPERPKDYTQEYHTKLIQWNITVENVTFELVKDNPKFKPVYFHHAAGYGA